MKFRNLQVPYNLLARLCFESCGLEGELDLSTCIELEDLRAASNTKLTDIIWPTEVNSLWHVCIGGDTSLNLTEFPVEDWPVIRDCWAAGNAIDGYLVFSTNASLSIIMDNCNVTGADITLAPNANYVDLSNNNLGQEAVDDILIALASHSVSNGTVNLANNAIPSAAGSEAASVLLGRSWEVNVDS